jgi:DNA-binding NarL/FixJ family response regulator
LDSSAIRILLYTQQPFVGAGVRAVIQATSGYELTECCNTWPEAVRVALSTQPDVVLIHLSARMSLGELAQLRACSRRSQIVLWGDGVGGEFALHAMQFGVRGILPSHTSVDGLLTSVLNVHAGVLCFEKEVVDQVLVQKRVDLTERQSQVISLVAQGFKNKEIATTLGITEGTVKVYLYKLFRKIGVNDRLEMALYGLKNLFAGRPDLERTGRSAGAVGPRSLPLQSRGIGLSRRVN